MEAGGGNVIFLLVHNLMERAPWSYLAVLWNDPLYFHMPAGLDGTSSTDWRLDCITGHACG